MLMRVMVFSPEAHRLEEMILQDARYHLLSVHSGETDVYSLLVHGQPDLAVLDENYPGCDVPHLLRRMQNNCILLPKILYLYRDAPCRDADALLAFPCESIYFARAMEAASASFLPRLCLAHLPLLEETAGELTRSLGINEELKGTLYIRTAAARMACFAVAPEMKAVYRDVAAMYKVSPASVERNIRTAVESTWLKGNLPAISHLFGYTVDPDRGKPTNSEFLSLLALHIQRKAQAFLTTHTQKG